MTTSPGDSQIDSQTLSHTAVVVVNFHSHGLLETNIVSVNEAAPEATIVIVDNFSTHAERDRAREFCDERGWIGLMLDRNMGFGGGVNAGVAAALGAGASSIVVLNPDATIGRPSLVRLARAVADDAGLMVAPVIRRSNGSVWFGGSDLYLHDGRIRNPRLRDEFAGHPYREWLTGACFAISSTLWSATGGFDDDYFLYWEDVDLSYRVQKAGGRLVVDGDAEAIHDAGGTQVDTGREGGKSEIYYYYNIRNRLIYGAKNVDPENLKRWLRETRRASFEILLRGGRRQFLRPISTARAYLGGMRDGRRFVANQRGEHR